jgi:blocked-early-in-transport protein 1
MSSSRSQEDTYEAQNDQRLDELHSKIRTLRGVSSRSHPHCAVCDPYDLQVTTDIYDDAERQNLVLDETVRFTFPPFLHAFATDPPGGARTIKDQYV